MITRLSCPSCHKPVTLDFPKRLVGDVPFSCGNPGCRRPMRVQRQDNKQPWKIGTTGLACAALGRRFVMSEIDPVHARLARTDMLRVGRNWMVQ